MLATQAEPLDERAVTGNVGLAQVVQQATTTTDEQQKAAPAVVVVLVNLQVFSEILDPLLQHGHLDLGGASIALDRRVIGHDPLLDVGGERHAAISSKLVRLGRLHLGYF